MAEGSFTSVVSGLMPDGFVIFDFRDIVRFALGILFCGFSVSLLCFVPGGGELEVLPSIHADLYSDIWLYEFVAAIFL